MSELSSSWSQTPALGIQVSNVAGASASTTSNMQDVKGDRASSKLKGKAKEDQTPSVNSADARTLEQLFRCTIPVEKKNIIHWGAWVNGRFSVGPIHEGEHIQSFCYGP